MSNELFRTPLYDSHVALGAKMVPFAGYEMPVQYPMGVMAEHLHTRRAAGLFDVSHMGQGFISGDPESLVPGDIAVLKPGRTRYTLLLNETGGALDDLMISRLPDGQLFSVVNAACKEQDFEVMRSVGLVEWPDRALLALQGPEAANVLARLLPDTASFAFMQCARIGELIVTRSGYTGEDGFEISLPADAAPDFWRRLVEQPEVKPIGLGARDSLRLEAGLCLYGHELDPSISPIEADLGWTISKRRREAGDFPGGERILRELRDGPSRKRVGIRPDGRAPAREGTEIVDTAGRVIGRITSGGFGPSLDAPIAMGMVETAHAALGTALGLVVRGKTNPARIVPLLSFPINIAVK